MSTVRTTSRWLYPLDAGGNNFTFDNLAQAAGDVVAKLYDADANELGTPAYSVSGVGSNSGGAVVFDENLGDLPGGVLVIELETQRVTVGSDPQDYIQDPAKTRQFNADQRLLLPQQLWNRLLRTLMFSPIEEAVGYTLPPPAQRAHKGLLFDAEGKPVVGTVGSPGDIVISGFMEFLLAAPDAATALRILGVFQPGDVKMWLNDVLPPGWDWCDGGELGRTEYPEVFAALGTTFGAGDGSTTFNKPDFRERAAVGRSTMGGSAPGRIPQYDASATGHAIGAGTVTLAVSQMPSHSHGITDPGHNHISGMSMLGLGGTGGGDVVQNQADAPIVIPINTTGIAINPQGGDQDHDNVQPGLVVNFIVYLGG